LYFDHINLPFKKLKQLFSIISVFGSVTQTNFWNNHPFFNSVFVKSGRTRPLNPPSHSLRKFLNLMFWKAPEYAHLISLLSLLFLSFVWWILTMYSILIYLKQIFETNFYWIDTMKLNLIHSRESCRVNQNFIRIMFQLLKDIFMS